MLVLTRRLYETIIIGDDIKVTVLRIDGNTIRLGISAPREVTVYRDVVADRIWAERHNPEPRKEGG